MTKPPTNIAASVFDRLKRSVRETGDNFNLALGRYAAERLLYRLSVSPHSDAFMLKGALLFAVWEDRPHRPTRDVDLLGFGEDSADRIKSVFREICRLEVPDDGVAFDPETMQVEDIREGQTYQGKRVTVKGKLGNARLTVQVDIGFGDALVHADRMITFPTLLDMPAPRLRAYPVETVIAEKLHAIIEHGRLNSRMKDFYDLSALPKRLAFDGGELVAALLATLGRRGVRFTSSQLQGLLSDLTRSDVTAARWTAFLSRNALTRVDFAAVAEDIMAFLAEPLQAVAASGAGATGEGFTKSWPAGGSWT